MDHMDQFRRDYDSSTLRPFIALIERRLMTFAVVDDRRNQRVVKMGVGGRFWCRIFHRDSLIVFCCDNDVYDTCKNAFVEQ